MESIVKETLDTYLQYYKIHVKRLTKEDIDQREKGIKRLEKIKERFFPEDQDFLYHLEQSKTKFQTEIFSIAVSYLLEEETLFHYRHKGFKETDLKAYLEGFKQVIPYLKNVETILQNERSNK